MKFKKLALILTFTLAFSGNAFSHEGHDHSREHEHNKSEKVTLITGSIRIAFPDVKSVILKHNALNKTQQSEIKKMAGMSPVSDDFHVYIIYGNSNGKKIQLGAATMVKPDKTQKYLIAYDNKLNIKKV